MARGEGEEHGGGLLALPEDCDEARDADFVGIERFGLVGRENADLSAVSFARCGVDMLALIGPGGCNAEVARVRVVGYVEGTR